MATNKDIDQSKERTIVQNFKHLFDANNQVISLLSNGEFHFHKATIKSVIDSHPLGRKKLKTLPVSALTVVGSDEYMIRNVLTFWLISYYEGRSPSNLVTVEHFYKAFHAYKKQIFENTKTAIYLWPKPYILQNVHKQPERVVLLFYSNSLSYQALDVLAAAACSQISVLTENERIDFKNKFDELWPQNDKNCRNCPRPNVNIMENSGKDDDFARIFIGSVCHNMESKGQFSNEKSFILHLKTLAALFNAASKDGRLNFKIETNKNKQSHPHDSKQGTRPISSAKSANTFSTLINADKSQDQETFQRSSEPGTTQECQLKSQVGSKSNTSDSTTMANAVINQPKNESSKSSGCDEPAQTENFLATDCNTGKCLDLEDDIKVMIHKWVTTKLHSKNIGDMLDCCKPLCTNDKHNIFSELNDVIFLVNSCSSEISNKFDNHVCFSEDDDQKILSQLCITAYRKAQTLLTEKNHVHPKLTFYVFKLACSQIHRNFITENERIFLEENMNTKKVLHLVEDAYNSKILEFIESNENEQDIMKYHLKIKDYCIGIIESCLNLEDRANKVASKAFELASTALDTRFQSIIKGNNLKTNQAENDESGVIGLIKVYIKEMHKFTNFEFEENSAESVCQTVTVYHNNVVEKITNSLDVTQTDDIQVRLYSYLMYTTEALLQKQQRCKGFISTSKVLNSVPEAVSIFITQDWMRFDIPSKNGYNHLIYRGKNSKRHPTLLVLSSEDKVCYGYLAEECIRSRSVRIKSQATFLDYVRNNVDSKKYTSYIMVKFFQQLQEDICKVYSSNFEHWVISVPIYVTNLQRQRLRNFAINAGLKYIYVVSETSMIAHGLLNFYETDKSSVADNSRLLVILQATFKFLILFVFVKNKKGQTQLLSSARKAWVLIDNSNSKSFNNVPEKNVQINPFRPDPPNTDCSATLLQAYVDAFTKLELLNYKGRIMYCIVNNDFRQEKAFEFFFNNHKNWFKIENFLGYLQSALTDLCSKPENISSTLIDHAIAVEDNDDFINSLNTSVTLSYHSSSSSNSTENCSTDTEFVEAKKLLLSYCSTIMSQISNGDVKVRSLMRKVILDCIKRAEDVGQNTNSTKEMITNAVDELKEFVEEYNFRID